MDESADARSASLRYAAGNLALESALWEAADALDARRIEFMVVKGVALARRLYGRIDNRSILDNDVVVPRALVRDAVEALSPLGYRPFPYYSLEAHLKTDFQFPLIRAGNTGNLTIDLHWNLFHPAIYRVHESSIWRRTEHFSLNGRTMFTTDKAMTLVHLAGHFAQHSFMAHRILRDLAAAWNLWSEEIDRDDLTQLARATGLVHALDFGLWAAEDLGELRVPRFQLTSRRAMVVRRLVPSEKLFSISDRKDYRRRLMPLLLAGPRAVVRMTLDSLFPPLGRLAAICHRPASPLLYLHYFVRPLRPITRPLAAWLRRRSSELWAARRN